MPEWEAPAKLNLDLRVGAVDSRGMHPLWSLVQTIEWTDLLKIEVADEDHLEVEGGDLPDDDNLVWKAINSLGVRKRPSLDIRLAKNVPVAAGLGGGSSDAAAAMAATAGLLKIAEAKVTETAPEVGADVLFFLKGGTARMEGYGERVTRLEPLEGFAVAVAVPDFELVTPEVYGRWDELERPIGPEVSGGQLPPALRPYQELRNDLTPAAVSLRADLADWIRDLEERWVRPVLMSGSGPACFGFFVDHDEAADALAEVTVARSTAAADLRPNGVAQT